MTDVLLRPIVAFALCLATAAPISAAKYQSNPELASDLKKLAGTHSAIVKLSGLAKSRAGHDVWLVRLGSGDDKKIEQRPAMLVVAGIEGNDLVGSFSAASWAERLASKYATDESVR